MLSAKNGLSVKNTPKGLSRAAGMKRIAAMRIRPVMMRAEEETVTSTEATDSSPATPEFSKPKALSAEEIKIKKGQGTAVWTGRSFVHHSSQTDSPTVGRAIIPPLGFLNPPIATSYHANWGKKTIKFTPSYLYIPTGAVSIVFGVLYLGLTLLLDSRGNELLPPPPEAFDVSLQFISLPW